MQKLLATIDLVIEFATPELLDGMAKEINEAETKANNDLAIQVSFKIVEYNKAASDCRNGGYPLPHPDLK